MQPLLFSLYFSFAIFSRHVTDGLSPSFEPSRRRWLSQHASGLVALVISADSSLATATEASTNSLVANSGELPPFLRDYTKLAPLGKERTFGDKTLGLSLEELSIRLANDLTMGSTGQGGYFLTGDLSREIFRDDAVFVDPTNRVSSLSQYQQALRILFDPTQSHVELLGPLTWKEEIVDSTGAASSQTKTLRTISAKVRSRGYLQLPWKPYVTAYETTIVYSIDDDGLIARQDQTWSKSATEALRQSFTPSFVPAPPSSRLAPKQGESAEVTRLFDILNGRRPYEYSVDERGEINRLIDQIVVASSCSKKDISVENCNLFNPSLLPGKWMLAYLQPGPDGTGIDRRIPFPELYFNDNFQVFGKDTVLNIGQVVGPWVDVRVSGTLDDEAPGAISTPKRFRANIQGGKLCVGESSGTKTNCIGLPIQGEGLFDSLYLGERLRVGQNINGGGARVVQIRIDQ